MILHITICAHAKNKSVVKDGTHLMFLWEELKKLLKHLDIKFCAVPPLNHGDKVFVCAGKAKHN